MVSIRDKVLPAGPRLLDFVAEAEPWAQYKLEDGTILRARLMMVKAIDEGIWTDGDMKGYPKINFQFQQVLDVTWPDDVVAQAKKARGEA